MNFQGIATEIMLTANEEKWQETHRKVADTLRGVYAIGLRNGRNEIMVGTCAHTGECIAPAICYCECFRCQRARATAPKGLPYRVDEADRAEAVVNPLWCDQPDGVR